MRSIMRLFVCNRQIVAVALPGEPETLDGLKLVRFPRSLAPTLVALPSMSLIPSAPFRLKADKRIK